MENEQNEKIGRFISEMRRQQGLTQKELAEALGVTDKAVSKWERSVSCPDIALIIPLAKMLGVTANELLSGEKTETASDPETAEEAVEKTVTYWGKSTGQKLEKIKQFLFLSASTAFMLAILICLICEFSISGSLSWSLIVLISVAAAWLWLFPLLSFQKKIVKKMLLLLSVEIIPYLALLSAILKTPRVLSLGSCVSLAALAGIWSIYGVWIKWGPRKYCALALSFLITIPMTWGINYTVSRFIGEAVREPASDLLNFSVSLILALFCFCLDYFTMHSRE